MRERKVDPSRTACGAPRSSTTTERGFGYEPGLAAPTKAAMCGALADIESEAIRFAIGHYAVRCPFFLKVSAGGWHIGGSTLTVRLDSLGLDAEISGCEKVPTL